METNQTNHHTLDQLTTVVHELIIDAQHAISGDEIKNGDPEPKKNPEVEPEKLPEEDPGVDPNTKPGKGDDDDDDDDDDNPYPDPEIGDDPERIRTRTTVM